MALKDNFPHQERLKYSYTCLLEQIPLQIMMSLIKLVTSQVLEFMKVFNFFFHLQTKKNCSNKWMKSHYAWNSNSYEMHKIIINWEEPRGSLSLTWKVTFRTMTSRGFTIELWLVWILGGWHFFNVLAFDILLKSSVTFSDL